MNILYICDEYPPGLIGGIGSVTQAIAREMVRQGHSVFVVGLYSYEFGGKDYEEDYGVQVYRLRYGFRLPKITKLYGLQRRLPNQLKQRLFAKADFANYISFIDKLVIKNNIEIIEQPDWVSYAYFMGLEKPILPKFNIPLVLKFHGSHTYSCHELGIEVNKYYNNIDHQQYERADYLSAVSAHTARVSQKIFGSNKPVAILHNSVSMPVSDIAYTREDNLVFFSGTLKETKGVFSLLKAWNAVIAERPDAKLVLFGKGDMKVLKNLIEPKNQNSVFFMGHQPREKLLKQLETATLAIYPSYIEAFSMAPLESMSKGCPTIYTKRSSGTEVIKDGITGLLVDPLNTVEIAEKILLLLNNSKLRNKLGLQGKKEIEERFELKKSVLDHISFYRSALDNFKNG